MSNEIDQLKNALDNQEDPDILKKENDNLKKEQDILLQKAKALQAHNLDMQNS